MSPSAATASSSLQRRLVERVLFVVTPARWQASFHEPVYAGETLEIIVRLVKAGNRSRRMEFEVYVMDKSYRSAANGQKPEPGHPGTYALLAAARERLLGVPPLPGMGPCLPSSIQGFVLDGASVYRMTVSTIHNIAL